MTSLFPRPRSLEGVPENIDIECYPRLICDECGDESDLHARGWQGLLALEAHGSEMVAVFCPSCVEAEFSDDEVS